jgi:hypothetical protein
MMSKSQNVQASGYRLGSHASLEDHLAVFIAAWEEGKAPTQIPPDWNGQTPVFASAVYMRKLSELLDLWHSESPIDVAPGSRAAYWCESHNEIFQVIQRGMLMRGRSLWLERRSDGLPEFVASDRPVIEGDFEMTAKTAAYLRFGDFLTGEPDRIGFCGFCRKPFLKRAQQKKFCAPYCAHRAANESSRLQNVGINERKRLRKAAIFVRKWLIKTAHRSASTWWKELQSQTGLLDVHGFQTRDGRLNRALGRYIRAAEAPPESRERARLMMMLSYGTQQPKELTKIQQELDRFLNDVQKAQKTGKGSKR